MQGIDYGNGPVYIIGHKSPDSDSVCTVIAYANLKRKLGVNAETANGISYGCATVVALTPEKRQALEKRLGDWGARARCPS